MSENAFLSILEAAKAAGVGDETIRQWVRSGQLPHYRLGRKPGTGKYAIAAGDLQRFLDGRRVDAAAPKPSRDPRPHQRASRKEDAEFNAYYERIMREAAAKAERRRQRGG